MTGRSPKPIAWSRLALVMVIVATTALAGCIQAPKWTMTRTVMPEVVGHTLDEPATVPSDIKPEDVPVLPVRTHLRPCCAFGTHLKASLGPIPVPFFSIGNIIDLDHIGPHKYDSGAFSLKGSSEKNAFSQEQNGLIYTCRGGFIDTAHVRDYADWTMFWAATIARSSVTGANIEMPPEGGHRRVILRPLPVALLDIYGLRRTAVATAQWLAFQLSIWHEIATAYGWASIDFYPEYVSAFSPEDLYSNLLGIKLAGGLLMQTGSTATDRLYDEGMDLWLRAALQYLQPVSMDAGEAATQLVDGVWWDSKTRLPDYRLVRRRSLDVSTEIAPWVISRAGSSPEIRAWIARECGGSDRPLILRRQESLHGIQFSDLLTFEIDVEVPDPFPYPRPDSTRITQQDFPAIIEAVRQKCFDRLGPGADRAER